jgi:sugar phosphate isomerase/epimerase
MNSADREATAPIVAAHHWSIFDLEVPAACAWAAEHGYGGLDLAVGDFGSGPRIELDVLARDGAECERLADAAAAAGVTFTDLVASVVYMPGMTADDRRRGLEQFAAFVPNASRLGLDGVTVLPGLRGDTDRAELFALTVEDLRRYVAIGAEHELAVSIEAHVESVTDSPEATLEMLAAVPGLTLTLDYSHFIHGGFTQDEIEPLNGHARHFHIRQAAPGRLAIEVSHGVIDHRRLVTDLAARGYSGSLTTEYVDAEWYGQNLVDSRVENAAMQAEIVGLLGELWNR